PLSGATGAGAPWTGDEGAVMDGTQMRTLLSLALLVPALLLAACGGSEDAAESLPGYSGDEVDVDRSRFELATPTTSGGPTTIPGGPTIPGEVRPVEGESTDFTTTTTTTTLPDRIPLPDSNALVCQSFFVVASAVKDGQAQTLQAAAEPGSVQYATVRDSLVTALQTAAGQLAASVPSGPVVDVPSALLRRLRSTAAYIASTQSFDQGGTLLFPLIVEPPFPGEQVGWAEIEAELVASCPELLLALTGQSTMN
ncbi:MAG: hypothetical protein ACK4V6_19175, partial [Microthrixaceae bacterium]